MNPTCALGSLYVRAPLEAFIPQPLDQLLHELHLHFALHLRAARDVGTDQTDKDAPQWSDRKQIKPYPGLELLWICVGIL